MAVFTFRKDERLRKKKLIEQLFSSNNSFYIYPFKVIWTFTREEQPYPAQILVSVGRRNMKRAVDRNRIKRMVRESYRHEKFTIYEYLEQHDRRALLAIIYTAQEMSGSKQVNEKINLVMSRLIKEFDKQLVH